VIITRGERWFSRKGKRRIGKTQCRGGRDLPPEREDGCAEKGGLKKGISLPEGRRRG